MKNFRDIELLSSYLDGQLSPSESARLESRISKDPELADAFNDIRAARGILRKLPLRKAPRNFTLTRKMVGLKPPLPRSYSFFRFSTAFATVLLILTFAANALTQLPRMSFAASGASAPVAQNAWGLGGGAGPAVQAPAAAAPAAAATEAPAAIAPVAPAAPIAGASVAPTSTNAPAAAAALAPAATEASKPVASPSMENAVAPTEHALPTVSADMSSATEAPAAKAAGSESVPQEQPQVIPERKALIPFAWQMVLLAVVLVSLLIMLALRQSAKQKWK
jgi:anti-sigma factor RsiW